MTVRSSTRAHGDFHPAHQSAERLERRRRRLVDLPWVMCDQRHGTQVVRVDDPAAADGAVGDVVVTDRSGVVVGVWAADCAPIVLVGAERSFAVVHAGWRGLAAGVVAAAVGALGEPVEAALLGPTIGPCCYGFGEDDLVAVARGIGTDPERIRATTRAGTAALDVPAAVRAALASSGVEPESLGGCTGCSYDGWSHRARRDAARHVVAAWQPEDAR